MEGFSGIPGGLASPESRGDWRVRGGCSLPGPDPAGQMWP